MSAYDDWIARERIGFAVTCLRSLGDVSASYLLPIDEWLKEEIPRWIPYRRASLPRAYQTAIFGVTPGELRATGFACADVWPASEVDQGIGDKSRPSAFEATAGIFAHHLVGGSGSARALGSLAKKLFRYWLRGREVPQFVETIDQALPDIRNATSWTPDKIKAVDTLIAAWSAPAWWVTPESDNKFYQSLLAHIADCIFVRLHAWPLLVLGDSTAISLPVAVDVDWSNVQEPATGHAVTIAPDKQTWIDAQRFATPLELAAQAAKDLWRSKHGNTWGHRNNVDAARFRVDLSMTERICEDLIPLRLSERSAEIYFSQIMLSRLLGKPGAFATVITGSIGPKRTAVDQKTGMVEDLLDYEIESPEAQGARLKLHHVIAGGRHERFVIPPLPEDQPAWHEDYFRALDRQGTEVITGCKYLQHVADCAQPEGWRQHRFIHCPDLAQTSVYTYQDEAEPDHWTKNFLELIKATTRSVLHAKGFSETTVVRALRRVNHVLRDGLASPGRYPPPMASYLFVRCVKDQIYDPFWMVVWSAIGGTEDSLLEFLLSPTIKNAAAVLQRELNHMRPTPERPGPRAPDVMVLIDTYHLAEANSKPAFSGVMQQRDVLAILDEIKLDTSHLHQLLGSTRVIIVPGQPVKLSHKSIDPPEHLIEPLAALSPFRWGFNVPMAARVLARISPGLDISAWLNALVETKVMRATAGGFYYIPEDGRMALRERIPTERAAVVQLACGLAYAPFLDRDGGPGLAMDHALLPWNVLEARHHFSQCITLLKSDRSKDANTLRDTVKNHSDSLLRFALPDSWWKVNQLVGNANVEAAELAEQMLADQPKDTDPPPAMLLEAASANSKVNWSLTRTGYARAHELYGLALNGTKALLDLAPKDAATQALLLCIASGWSVFLRNDPVRREFSNKGKADELTIQVKVLDALINDFLRKGVDGKTVRGEWFECMGDERLDNLEAAKEYLRGLQHVKDWGQLWVKAAGTLNLAYGANAPSESQWRELKKLVRCRLGDEGGVDYFKALLAWASRPKIRVFAAKDRFLVGVNLLSKIVNARHRFIPSGSQN